MGDLPPVAPYHHSGFMHLAVDVPCGIYRHHCGDISFRHTTSTNRGMEGGEGRD